MKKCPFCAEEVQEEAVKCRYCGEFIDGRAPVNRQMIAGHGGMYTGYEYRSKMEIMGLPLLHIAHGYDPVTGRIRVAKGIIATGNIALGVVAVGGISLGGFVIGGMGLGIFVLAGVAAGGVALGGIALALYLAVGGLAISMTYAIGGLAIAPHTISSMGSDPELMELLEKWWSKIRKTCQ